ncbi:MULTISPECIES: PEP-CTERM sorting domain-containing protein [unclassified Agarivorans]|uniref:PEP-CTERM sorting domain-containing protein n=1 Tax=unclassified Agarivorans TaxID=2636026 RepID=UPI003D7CF7C1
MKIIMLSILSLLLSIISVSAFSNVVLYEQDFENPTGYINGNGDASLQSVNALYGDQPTGFSFAQKKTVETLYISGNEAYGTGYLDSSRQGGNYALGMQNSPQNDLIGLSFNVGHYDFLNFMADISSIELSSWGPHGVIGTPIFEFTLFDNPTGVNGTGSGKVLDSGVASGTASDVDTFDWSSVLLPLETDGNTNGNVTLRIDLLGGGYAAIDNLLIVASDIPNDVQVPEPSSIFLLSLGLIGLMMNRRKTLTNPHIF